MAASPSDCRTLLWDGRRMRQIWLPSDGDGDGSEDILERTRYTKTGHPTWKLFTSDVPDPIVRGKSEPPHYIYLDDRAAYDILQSPAYTALERSSFWPFDYNKSGKIKAQRFNRGRAVVDLNTQTGYAITYSGSKKDTAYNFTGGASAPIISSRKQKARPDLTQTGDITDTCGSQLGSFSSNSKPLDFSPDCEVLQRNLDEACVLLEEAKGTIGDLQKDIMDLENERNMKINEVANIRAIIGSLNKELEQTKMSCFIVQEDAHQQVQKMAIKLHNDAQEVLTQERQKNQEKQVIYRYLVLLLYAQVHGQKSDLGKTLARLCRISEDLSSPSTAQELLEKSKDLITSLEGLIEDQGKGLDQVEATIRSKISLGEWKKFVQDGTNL